MSSFIHAALLALSLCLAAAPAVRADLPFNLSYSKQCQPLNVTWTPVAANYPYTVTIGAIGFGGEIQERAVVGEKREESAYDCGNISEGMLNEDAARVVRRARAARCLVPATV